MVWDLGAREILPDEMGDLVVVLLGEFISDVARVVSILEKRLEMRLFLALADLYSRLSRHGILIE